MMKILKSSADLVPDFEVKVAAYAHEMGLWRAHMRRVQDDDARGVTGIERHWPLQRPTAHPLVETAINENDEAAYEIVDDGPSESEILAVKKRDLMARVSEAERIAIVAVVPAGKRRLYEMRQADIASRPVGALRKAAMTVGLVGDDMSEDDATFMEMMRQQSQRIDAISRVAAQAHHDIEDLTIDTVDIWMLPVFPT